MSLPATVSEIFGGQTTPSILVAVVDVAVLGLGDVFFSEITNSFQHRIACTLGEEGVPGAALALILTIAYQIR